MKVTAENLTDKRILKFGRAHRDGTINDAIARHLCTVVLGLGSPILTDDEIAEARQRIVDAINARTT